jgi:membrane associated rhomboid family serine protease
VFPGEIAVVDGLGGDLWKLATSPFVHGTSLGYGFVTMLATGIFGMHLERRFGPVAPVAVFLLAGAAGVALAVVTGLTPALGASGAALGLLCAWLVEDRRAAARGEDRGNDLIGVAVVAAVLALLSLATLSPGGPEASVAAAGGGAVVGALCGLALSFVRR